MKRILGLACVMAVVITADANACHRGRCHSRVFQHRGCCCQPVATSVVNHTTQPPKATAVAPVPAKKPEPVPMPKK